MADLRVEIDGLKLSNPFLIGSGPPGTNANVISKAFKEGWGGVIAKTISLDSDKIRNVAPRYARMRASQSREVIGWENIELISDRSFELWLDEFKRIKDAWPEGVLVASIMEEYRRDAWQEIVGRCEEVGVDAFELNFSCPHGLPERKMGSAMGQDPTLVAEVCRWVDDVSTIPVWAKMTPNITHITEPARAALEAGCDGISAINTILSVMGVDLETLRPEPNVEGYTISGGYSGRATRPIALRMVMELATMMYGGNAGQRIPSSLDGDLPPNSNTRPFERSQAMPIGQFDPATSAGSFPAASLSAIGGVESGEDAAQYILLGASTVQACTGVMIHGYGLVETMCQQLAAFMDKHGFKTVDEFRGHSLQYFTTHAELVRRQSEMRRIVNASESDMVTEDRIWNGDRFVEQSQGLLANK